MKAKLKLITVAMLGVGITGLLLASLSVHAEMNGDSKITESTAVGILKNQ